MIKLIVLLFVTGFVRGKEPFTLDEYLEGKFVNKGWNGVWVNGNSFIFKNDSVYQLKNIETDETKELVKGDVLDKYPGASFSLSPDQKYILIRYNAISIFRHSTTAQYAVYSLVRPASEVIHQESQLQYCRWGPDNSIIYVFENNIYHISSVDTITGPTTITKDGLPRLVYNGVPDWVYEEEVLSSGSALWISPNGQYLAYAKFDDTDVRQFIYLLYGEPGNLQSQYPTVEDLKYPKVGTTNPKFSVYYVDLKATTITPKQVPLFQTDEETKNYVLGDVAWTPDNKLAVLIMNRIQNQGYLASYKLAEADVTKLKEYKEDNGWLDLQMPLFESDWYVQVVTKDNLKRIVYQKNGFEEEVLTSGNKTVTSIYGHDASLGVLYFAASGEGDHAQQHVYTVDITKRTETCITCSLKAPEDNVKCKYAQASFSKDFSYASITCQGPGAHYVQIRNMVKSTTEVARIWEGNDNLREALKNKDLPTIQDLSVPLESGFTAAVRMLLPPNLDTTKKYPMIVNVYAGPNSNQIKDSFSVGFQNYLVTNRKYIYVYIDGRGSGRRGNDLMFQVYKKLGTVEIEDQIAVTKELQKRFSYVDGTKTAIWGWSYGGFATAWAIAKDTEKVFNCGVSVAPVTSFIYYDSIYTERYMDTPQNNAAGYNNTDVTRQAADFKNKTFLLIHGNGDDNVHYQQSMMLARALELADVQFSQMSYPDEDHSLNGVLPHLYHTIDRFFADNFDLPAPTTNQLPYPTLPYPTLPYPTLPYPTLPAPTTNQPGTGNIFMPSICMLVLTIFVML